MMFCERLFMLRFSRPYPGLDDTREWGGLIILTGTVGDSRYCWWLRVIFLDAGGLTLVLIRGFRLFRIPGLNLRVLAQMVTQFSRHGFRCQLTSWLWVTDVCDSVFKPKLRSGVLRCTTCQSWLHHLHHSMFIFQKKKNNAWKKLTRIRISFSGSFMIK